MKTFQGTMVALATPFANGGLDEAAYRSLIDYQLKNGVEVLIPVGSTGEAICMSAQERKRAISLAVEAAQGKAPVVAGAGCSSTQETIENVKAAREAGADGVLVVTPAYNKPTQEGLVEHFRAVAKAHPGFPIVAYNVPGRTGVDLLPDTCARLCEIPEVVALKEATGNIGRTVDLVEKCGDRLTLLSGDDFTVQPFMAAGGKGVISVSANVAPRLMSDLVQAARNGNFAQSLELQVRLNPLHRLLFVESNPIPVKWALHLMKLFGPEIRLPLTPLSPGNAEKLSAELRRLKLI